MTASNNPESGETRIEDDIDRLESLVRQLETGKEDLDRSLSLFEEGVRLAGRCQSRLEALDQRILEVSKSTEGTVSLTPFAHDPTHTD